MHRISPTFLVAVGLLCGVLLMALFGADHTPVGVNGPSGPPVPAATPIEGVGL